MVGPALVTASVTGPLTVISGVSNLKSRTVTAVPPAADASADAAGALGVTAAEATAAGVEAIDAAVDSAGVPVEVPLPHAAIERASRPAVPRARSVD